MNPLTILSTLSLFGLMILIIIGMYKMVKLIGDKSTKDAPEIKNEYTAPNKYEIKHKGV